MFAHTVTWVLKHAKFITAIGYQSIQYVFITKHHDFSLL